MKGEENNFKKELEFVLSTKIFYKEPNSNRVLLFSFLYFLFTAIGVSLGLYFLVTIFTLPLLLYILAARGNSYFILISLLSLVNIYLISSIDAVVWNFIHIVLASLLHQAIKYRYSKLFILMGGTSFIFFSITIYMHVLFSTSIINYSPEAIQLFIDNYISQLSSLQPSSDAELFREAFEQLKRYAPTLLFLGLVVYSLVLINYTMLILSKEKAIVPVFPRLKFVAVGRSVAYIYIFVTLALMLVILSGVEFYNPYYLFIDNVYSIFRWIFVFNGVCATFFFIEEKAKSASGLFKVITVISAYLFSGLFDIIGLVDSLTRLRENYVRMKGGK